ncbi:hypothetical protein Hypma_003968 [Hypsizygus marmoreus]|uniref:Uncharacterized protein n=1 Tax=Hypsizygus marmoreus TaxID=39966 RepID=A0A369J2X0_HYPMA|nr:hypothetical protein Hypma_003968 [Hypsizygus marmoreus]
MSGCLANYLCAFTRSHCGLRVRQSLIFGFRFPVSRVTEFVIPFFERLDQTKEARRARPMFNSIEWDCASSLKNILTLVDLLSEETGPSPHLAPFHRYLFFLSSSSREAWRCPSSFFCLLLVGCGFWERTNIPS